MSLAQTALALRNAEAASTETLVKMVNPDWSQEDVDAEVERIGSQGPAPLPPPDDAGL